MERLLFPRLAFLLDIAWARRSDAISRIASDLLQGLTLAAIVAMACPALRGAAGGVMLCFAAMVLWSAAQRDNIYMGFQVQFVVVYTAAVGAVPWRPLQAGGEEKEPGSDASRRELVRRHRSDLQHGQRHRHRLVVALLVLVGRNGRAALATAMLVL